MQAFSDDFKGKAVLQETGSMQESSSEDWWLNSGGKFFYSNGIAETQQGNLPDHDEWRKLYAETTPIDTDNGYHPQNVFRLVLREKRKDFKQEVYFRITADNLDNHDNRKEANGLFLLNRYRDGDNLYYTGIREDGAAVIEKKFKGTYFTMNYEPVYNKSTYDVNDNPNLLPKNEWIGLKSAIATDEDGYVSIKLFVDLKNNGSWKLVTTAIDKGETKFGGETIAEAGYAGIGTDFMDVQFKGYKIRG